MGLSAVGLYMGLSAVGLYMGLAHMELACYLLASYLQLETTASRAMLAVADTFQACQSTPDRYFLGQDGKVRPLYLYCMPWAGKVWVCGQSPW